MKKIVSVQGLAGSFHEMAARKYFGQDVSLVHRPDFAAVFEDLASGKASKAVVAYKNTQYGKIYEVDELINEQKPTIIDSVSLEVKFCLLAPKGSSLDIIEEVYSQVPAIVQCHNYLEREIPNARAIENYDTAGAAADVAKWNDPKKAALASKLAAEIYGLEVIAEGVEDAIGHNATDFYIISK